MKKLIPLILLLNSLFVVAQDDDLVLRSNIKTLQEKIAQTKNSEKLVLLDSLSRLTTNRSDLQFETITKETIELAYQLDSLRIAADRTASLIHYYAYTVSNVPKAIRTFEEFLLQNKSTKNKKVLAKVYMNGATSYFFSGAVEKAINTYNQTEKFALAGKDSITYAQARTYKASLYSEGGNHVEASKLLKETAAIFSQKKDTAKLLEARMISSTIYGRVGFYKEAQQEMDEIVKLADLSKKHGLLLSTLYNSAVSYNQTQEFDKRLAAMKHANNHIIEHKLKNERIEPLVKYGLLSAYITADSLTQATKVYNEIENTVATTENLAFEEQYLDAKVNYFIAIKKYHEAKKIAEKLLELRLQSKNIEAIYKAHLQLAKCYKALNDYKNAYTNYTKYESLKDSINAIQKIKSLSYYQTLYETEKRDFKIAAQQNEIVILDQQNKTKKQWLLLGGIGLLAIFSIAYLLRSRRFAKKQKELQEAFSQELINEQEKERSRLARELHDSVGQKLMLLSRQTKKIGDENMKSLASSTLDEVRTISRGLHPSNLERLGLTEAINALVYDINANTELFFTEDIDNIDNLLSKEKELHLYRIIQESLSNIVKHAEAKAVKMNVQKKANHIDILVSDNGKGFDFESKYKNMSLGLKTLFERAKIINSQLDLHSNLDQGTKLTLRIPL